MPARELTDPGRISPPTDADVDLALAEIVHDHPEAADTLRHALVARAAERLSVDLIREAIRQQERTEGALRTWEPVMRRAIEALELEVATKAKTQAQTERQEVTALEHVKGAWAALQTAAGNRAVIAAGSGGIMWLVTRLSGWLDGWFTP